MGTRIRYTNDGQTLRSTRYINTDVGEMSVTIYIEHKSATIDNSGGTFGYNVTGSSLHKVKMAVKKKLTELGAVFEEESRTKDANE